MRRVPLVLAITVVTLALGAAPASAIRPPATGAEPAPATFPKNITADFTGAAVIGAQATCAPSGGAVACTSIARGYCRSWVRRGGKVVRGKLYANTTYRVGLASPYGGAYSWLQLPYTEPLLFARSCLYEVVALS